MKYNFMKSIPHQELFLCDEKDAEDYRKTVYAEARAVIIIFCTSLAAVVFASAVTAQITLPYAFRLTLLCAGPLIFFAAFVITLIVFDRRTSRIFQTSLSKLGNSLEDNLKRQLHSAYVRNRRAGNIMFLSVNVGGILIGAALGYLGYIWGDSANLWENVGCSTAVFFILAAIASFIIWAIMYRVYLSRIAPAEEELLNAQNRGGE